MTYPLPLIPFSVVAPTKLPRALLDWVNDDKVAADAKWDNVVTVEASDPFYADYLTKDGKNYGQHGAFGSYGNIKSVYTLALFTKAQLINLVQAPFVVRLATIYQHQSCTSHCVTTLEPAAHVSTTTASSPVETSEEVQVSTSPYS